MKVTSSPSSAFRVARVRSSSCKVTVLAVRLASVSRACSAIARSFRARASRAIVRSACSTFSRAINSLVLLISESCVEVLAFICSTLVSSRRVATAICACSWPMSASMSAIRGGAADSRRLTAKRPTRDRANHLMARTSESAIRKPTPMNSIGSLMAQPNGHPVCDGNARMTGTLWGIEIRLPLFFALAS